ncbi:hypothetical protein JYT44_02690 [Caldithrix abyssi]|nr:hypothetical protein [Caldithrix abyssi]
MAISQINNYSNLFNSLGWQQERFPFDAFARNQKIEKIFLNYFTRKTSLKIVDVGSGLAANTRYSSENFPFDQDWTLIENDPIILENCLQTLIEWAKERQWPYVHSPNELELYTPNKYIHIKIVRGSFMDLDKLVDLSEIDLITASAVFDLFSKNQFRTFAHILASHRLPLFTTLNYLSMVFEPQGTEDHKYIKYYENHMTQPREFGSKMGPYCSQNMTKILENVGYHITTGSSNWLINSKNSKMMNYLLRFMHVAIREMLKSPTELNQLEQWISNKKQLVQNGELSLKVNHMDIWSQKSNFVQ